MTTMEMNTRIGQDVIVTIEKAWQVKMIIKDCKISWGSVNLLVGSDSIGYFWVSENRCKFI